MRVGKKGMVRKDACSRCPMHFIKALMIAVVLAMTAASPSASAAPSASANKSTSTDWIGDRLDLPRSWVSIPTEYGWVHADPADRPVAIHLAQLAAARIPDLATELQVPVGRRIHIVLAHTQAQFEDLQPGTSPDWADGTAWPSRGWIFLRSPKIRDGTATPLPQVLDHEIVHILLGRAFYPRPVPRWLQEGMAQLLAREYTAETTRTLAAGTLGKNLLSIHEISRGFPRNAARAHLAYAQSADLVAFIQSEYGPNALPTLVREMVTGERFAPALAVATGHTMDEVDATWRGRLTDSPFALSALTDEGIWWGLGALLVPLAWFSVRRRNQKRIEGWKREEILEDALTRVIERMEAGRRDAPQEEMDTPSFFTHPIPKDPTDWH
jgi:hypothetical protein